MLDLCDRTPCRVQCKGATLQWRPQFVVFTANAHPNSWYDYGGPGSNLDYSAFERRIDLLIEHQRVEAPVGTLAVGDIVVRIHRGRVQWHPLKDYLEPIGDQDGVPCYRLREDDLKINEFDTLPSDQVMDELYSRAVAKHPEPAMDVDGEGAVEPHANYHLSSHEEVDNDQMDSFDDLSGFIEDSSESEDLDGWSSDVQEIFPHDGDPSYIAVPVPDGLMADNPPPRRPVDSP